ncbi:hypothetical protein, partial [Paramuribaculum intestinale]|uniref:hypothetical protein n=1 Tax=Paramuribaculum intestinale TaxID=2094151 RepID=UPI0025B75AA5
QYLLFVTSKLLNISDITKRIGSFFKLPIQLFYGVPYPELALLPNGCGFFIFCYGHSLPPAQSVPFMPNRQSRPSAKPLKRQL